MFILSPSCRTPRRKPRCPRCPPLTLFIFRSKILTSPAVPSHHAPLLVLYELPNPTVQQSLTGLEPSLSKSSSPGSCWALEDRHGDVLAWGPKRSSRPFPRADLGAPYPLRLPPIHRCSYDRRGRSSPCKRLLVSMVISSFPSKSPSRRGVPQARGAKRAALDASRPHLLLLHRAQLRPRARTRGEPRTSGVRPKATKLLVPGIHLVSKTVHARLF